jgi:hypothetical protein
MDELGRFIALSAAATFPMNPYPAVDPIPLPAPMWLLKLLHIVTLSLHFVAVEMLLGGLLLAVLLSLFRKSPQLAGHGAGAGAPAHGGDDLCDQPGRAAALVCAGALRPRALHQQRADRLYWIAIIGTSC